MEIYTDKVKLRLTTEEARTLIEDATLELLVGAILSLDVSLRVVDDFNVVQEEVVTKVKEKARKQNTKGEYNLIEKLYNNLVLNDSSDGDLTQSG